MDNDEIDEYMERDAFLRKMVAIMARISEPGEAVKVLPELLKTNISDADREKLFEIMDEYIKNLQELKVLCVKIYKTRD